MRLTANDPRERAVESLLTLCIHSDAIFESLKESDSGTTAVEIAALIGTTPATVYKTLRKMIEIEVVDYKYRPGRGKAKFYFLTDAGRRMRSIYALKQYRPWIYQPKRSSNADAGIY